jgi:hypothetical protein
MLEVFCAGRSCCRLALTTVLTSFMRWKTPPFHLGVGHHPNGSHVFGVWRDPNGYRFETYSDNKMFNISRPLGLHDVSDEKLDVWSEDPRDRYFA